MEDYRFTLTPDKITRSNVDLGSLGGPRLAGDERKNITYLMINSVKTKLFKMNFFVCIAMQWLNSSRMEIL